MYFDWRITGLGQILEQASLARPEFLIRWFRHAVLISQSWVSSSSLEKNSHSLRGSRQQWKWLLSVSAN